MYVTNVEESSGGVLTFFNTRGLILENTMNGVNVGRLLTTAITLFVLRKFI